MVGAAGPFRPTGADLGLTLGTLSLPASWPAGSLRPQPLGAFRAALDGAVADAGPGGAAFGVHVGHHPKAEDLDLLGATQPHHPVNGKAAA